MYVNKLSKVTIKEKGQTCGIEPLRADITKRSKKDSKYKTLLVLSM